MLPMVVALGAYWFTVEDILIKITKQLPVRGDDVDMGITCGHGLRIAITDRSVTSINTSRIAGLRNLNGGQLWQNRLQPVPNPLGDVFTCWIL